MFGFRKYERGIKNSIYFLLIVIIEISIGMPIRINKKKKNHFY